MAEGSRKILVVDDEPDTRTFLTTVLEDNGYRTQQAADGEQAIKAIEEDPPDLITLDISMPEKSGVSVYRRVKESDQYKTIPVIMVTGVSGDFKKFISTRRQVPPPDGYISKPVEHEEFLRLVRKLLS